MRFLIKPKLDNYLTFTLSLSVTPFVLTVIVALPFFLAVILPFLFTVATEVLLDLKVALPTLPVILIVKVLFFLSDTEVLLSLGF